MDPVETPKKNGGQRTVGHLELLLELYEDLQRSRRESLVHPQRRLEMVELGVSNRLGESTSSSTSSLQEHAQPPISVFLQ
jgi:hypothetical protein